MVQGGSALYALTAARIVSGKGAYLVNVHSLTECKTAHGPGEVTVGEPEGVRPNKEAKWELKTCVRGAVSRRRVTR